MNQWPETAWCLWKTPLQIHSSTPNIRPKTVPKYYVNSAVYDFKICGIPILRDFYRKYQNTFQNIAFTVLLKPPLSQYTQANIQRLDSLTSLNILKNNNVFESLWADMNLKSFANCHKTGHWTHMACPASKQNTSWVFAPWFQVTVSNNLISMYHVHL